MTFILNRETEHFAIEADDTRRDAWRLAGGLAETCERDYDLIASWFRGVQLPPGRVTVRITAGEPDRTPIAPLEFRPDFEASRKDVRCLFVATVSRLFMREQNRGWLDSTGFGPGNALARYLGSVALAANGLGAPSVELQPGNAWMRSIRRDYVNRTGDGEHADGCGVLFLYYLQNEMKFMVPQIVDAGAPTLAGVYRNLTGSMADAFVSFRQLLDSRYPPGTPVDGSHPDNPWPIGHLVQDVTGGRFRPLPAIVA